MNRGARSVAACAGLALGCSLVTSIDDLKRVDDPCDACVDATAEAGLDAATSLDASPGEDSAVVVESGADVVIDAAPPPFCASLTVKPKLCEDFDNGLFSAQFPNVHVSPAATLAASATAFRSPSESLIAVLPVAATNGDDAFMTHIFANATATTMRYAFDFRIDGWVTGGATSIVATLIVNDSLPTRHAFAFYVTDTSAAIEEVFDNGTGLQFVDHALSAPILLGVWTHVTFDLDAVHHTCHATLDGASVLDGTLDASWVAGEPAADLGITYVASQTSAWALRYDNVVIDWL